MLYLYVYDIRVYVYICIYARDMCDVCAHRRARPIVLYSASSSSERDVHHAYTTHSRTCGLFAHTKSGRAHIGSRARAQEYRYSVCDRRRQTDIHSLYGDEYTRESGERENSVRGNSKGVSVAGGGGGAERGRRVAVCNTPVARHTIRRIARVRFSAAAHTATETQRARLLPLLRSALWSTHTHTHTLSLRYPCIYVRTRRAYIGICMHVRTRNTDGYVGDIYTTRAPSERASEESEQRVRETPHTEGGGRAEEVESSRCSLSRVRGQREAKGGK